MAWKKVSVLWHFCVKICEIWWTHLNFNHNIHSLSLTFNGGGGHERQELAGWKMALHFSPKRMFLKIYRHEFWWKWVIFLEWSGSRAIGGSGHLVLMVPRGGVMSGTSEPLCSVRTLNVGLTNPHSPWLSAYFFAAWFSVCSATGEHIKKRAMQSCFLVLPPPDYIAKIATNFVWGVAFENQMLFFGGGRTIWFIPWWRKKELSDISQKWVSTK